MSMTTTRPESTTAPLITTLKGIVTPSKRTWPNPEISLGQEFTPLRHRLKVKRRWGAIGPAKDAFLEISEELQNLKSLRDDLDELEDKSAIWGITCCMVGRFPEDARPSIVVHCQSKACCERIIKAIESTLWWTEFKEKYPSFTFVIDSKAPRPIYLSGVTNDPRPSFGSDLPLRRSPRLGNNRRVRSASQSEERRSEYSEIDTNLSSQLETISETGISTETDMTEYINEDGTFCGRPILYSFKNSHGSQHQRKATLGGIWIVGGVAYGLTVAHPFYPGSISPDRRSLPSSRSDFDDVEFMDDSDDENEDEEEIVGITSQGEIFDAHH